MPRSPCHLSDMKDVASGPNLNFSHVYSKNCSRGWGVKLKANVRGKFFLIFLSQPWTCDPFKGPDPQVGNQWRVTCCLLTDASLCLTISLAANDLLWILHAGLLTLHTKVKVPLPVPGAIHTQFQVLPGKLPFWVILKVLEIYVDIIIVTGSNHLNHLKLGFVLGFLLEIQRVWHHDLTCFWFCMCVFICW